ncbi:RHS repeat-associated protein [Actinomadura pelletieri DSM 43383]|uniref:RHS repeat-associated protein n=1 Tax=Actinomadura pelletieri DSM 43383 TaxID=1120940 RepID=A0A495QTZ2_9ACTN|nr:RHS repeat-associated protein [Actinomadura pelletieri DSM 43383]
MGRALGRSRLPAVVVGLALLLSGLSASVGPVAERAEALSPSSTGCLRGDAKATPAAASTAYRASVAPGAPRRLAHAGAELTIGPDAVSKPVEIGIQRLTEKQVPELGTGMDNLSKGGYRFTPSPHRFDAEITVSLPYDPAVLKASGMTAQDVHTFFFDEPTGCWRALRRVSVDEKKHRIVSVTDHFTDMVNATVVAPEGPAVESFDPNRLSGIQAASPATGVNQIAVPEAGHDGAARLSYPIELPKGRAGLQPSLAVNYSSADASGWLGMGWNLTVPSIGVETRWGVPRYDAERETETYVMGGEQLAPVAHRQRPVPREGDKVFRPRVEGGFARIVRRGDSPKKYEWEVTDKAGSRWLYGGEGATLADDDGDIFSWALREVRDRNGNTIRYHHVRVDDTGVQGGAVDGRNLYVKRISYTGHGDSEGPYSVTFVRDRELFEARRPDVSIDARGGFKRVTADLLRRVEVRLNDTLVRKYDFAYEQGAFGKTLLKSIEQFDADGKPFNKHTFDYFDDIRGAGGAYDAFNRVNWESPDDNVRNGVVDGVRSGAGEAGALNGNTSTGLGGHLYVGYGFGPTKNGSVGLKTGYQRGSQEGLLALIDVDGDDLPDKVFRSGNGYVFRKNLSRPGGSPRFAETRTPLRNLPGLFDETSSTRVIGVEGYLGRGAAQLNHTDTVSTSRRYFTDVNSDGVADLVNGRGVLFGRVGADGTVTYGSAADTPVPIGPSKVDPNGLLPDYGPDRDRRDDSFPLVDSLRRWTAPYDGVVRVTGAVRLLPSQDDPAEFGKPDGVRVAVQFEDRELWSKTIAADDRGEHTPGDVDAIPVKRGQRLYFRVGSVNDGTGDRVAWNPQIAYTGMAPVTDANGLPLHSYTASTDFTLAGRASTVAAPADGTLHLTGDLVKKAATTDDVTILITRDGRPVLEKKVAADSTGTTPVDVEVPVTQGQKLVWRLKVDSPIDVSVLDWQPVADYVEAEGMAELRSPAARDARFDPVLRPPFDIDTYPVSSATAPPRPYTVTEGGTLTVVPRLAAAPGVRGGAVFTVKKRGALLAKRTVELGAEPPEVAVPVETGDELFFDFAVADAGLAGKITGHEVTVGGTTLTGTLHGAAPEGVFGRPYRGWSMAGYNGNKERAGRPIRQADLAVTDDIRGQLPGEVDPPKDREEFEKDPRVKPPNVVPFTPRPEYERWDAGEYSWVSAGEVSSARFGGRTIGLPTADDFDDVSAVPRMSRTKQISLSGGGGGGVISVGGSVADGTTTGELDYLDMNADGFPDVVGAGGVQYTDPTGVLGATRSRVPGGAVRKSENVAGNANAGSSARTISTGRGHAAPPAWGTSNTSSSGNEMPPLGLGGNHGTARSDAEYDLLDINGDGLPDRVHEDGRAALNLGYRFAAPEPWPGGKLNEGTTTNSGLNIGFNTDFYGIGGGASFEQSSSSTKNSLADVNGDGLIDRVFTGNPIRVALNTGTGFAAPVPFNGSLDGVNEDRGATLGAGAYARFSLCFLVGCVVVNPGANASIGVSRTQQTLRDINGDGLADHLASGMDGELQVASNQTGRTNLLRSVHRPLGSRIDLDYTRDGNTYDQPGSRRLMSSVSVSDGLPGDGPDAQKTTFTYENGAYDRREREFLGYGRVTAQDRTDGGEVYRTVTRDYDTRNHYTRGLLKREAVADGSGALYTETLKTYVLRDVGSGDVTDGRGDTVTVFAELVRTDQRWYEGRAEPGKSTSTEMSYDRYGNVVRTVDRGEPGAADDVETTTRYTECADTHIVGVAQATEARSGGELLNARESTVDCDTGNVTRHRAKSGTGDDAVTDVTYNDNGTIASIKSPANHRGQRYERAYTYDDTTGTYVTSTVDSFGLRSGAAYDLRFGQVTTATDANGQEQKTTYDAIGRVDSVTGPHDHDAGRPTIDFEYRPDAEVPYAVTRHLDRAADGSVKADTIDTVTFTDGSGRPVQTKKDAEISGSDAMTVSGRAVFDEFGRVVEQYYPTSEPKGPANVTFNPRFDTVRPTTSTYDVLDRTLRVQAPDQTVTTTSYGFGADRSGTTQLETVATDANGNQTRTYTDARDRTTAVREPGAEDGQAPIWTSYAYDGLGRLTRTTDDHGNVTTTAYDLLGRRTKVTGPDSGTTTTVYDPAGNVVRKITANLAAAGKAVAYTYDHNRLTAISYPTFTGNDVRYTYGEPGARHNGAGRVVEVRDATGRTARKYGPLGEITEETRRVDVRHLDSRTFTTSYRYDSWNRMLRMTFPDGEVLSYGYDSGGRVTSADGVKRGQRYHYLARQHYDEFGQRTLTELGNGTVTRYTYDTADRRLAVQEAKIPQGYAFQNLRYDYDDVGNVTSIENDTTRPTPQQVWPKVGGPTKQTFEYDDLDRLTSARGEFDMSADLTDRYRFDQSYDTIHNLTSKTQQHELVTSAGHVQGKRDTSYAHQYTYLGAGPHAATRIGDAHRRYDANGNLTSSDTQWGRLRRQMVWDEDNRLACVQDSTQAPDMPQNPDGCYAPGKPPTVRFLYDDQGNRVIKQSLRTHVYPSQTYTQRDNVSFKHVFVDGARLATKTVKEGPFVEDAQFFYQKDHLGTTGFGTDAQGRVIEHNAFFPSGETWISENLGERNPYQFSGKELDPETGHYYYGARYYDPRSGGWLSTDPAAEGYLSGAANGGVYNSRNLSSYSHTYNNPVKLTDPDGRVVNVAAGAAGAVAGAMLGAGIELGAQWWRGEGYNWRAVAGAAAGGAVSGALAGVTLGGSVAATGLTRAAVVGAKAMSVGAVSGAAGGAVSAAVTGQDVVSGAVVGGVAGAISVPVGHAAGRIASKLHTRFVASPKVPTAVAAQRAADAAETVPIFRNVDGPEFDSIATTKKFETAPGQMEGKWFATQGEHAEEWGKVLNKGQGLTVTTRIPRSLAEKLHYHPGKLDNIGPAYYADADQLIQINERMTGIELWP